MGSQLDKTLGNKLKQMQRKILLTTSGALRSTPTGAMEVILGLIPLDLQIIGLAARSQIRTNPRSPQREHPWIEWEISGEEAELTLHIYRVVQLNWD